MTSNKKQNLVFSIVAFAVVTALLPSCSMPRFAAVEAESPYVQTKSDKRVTADVVEIQESENGSKNVIAGFNAFPIKTVAAFSDGKAEYHNVGDSSFARKVVSGKVNMFTNQFNRYGGPASIKPYNYYVQNGQGEEVSRMSYDVLKTMIPPDASARRFLDRYKRTDMVSKIAGGLALALAGTGVFQIISDKSGKPGIPGNPSGIFVASTGVWVFITAAVMNEENKANLFKAVQEYNTH